MTDRLELLSLPQLLFQKFVFMDVKEKAVHQKNTFWTGKNVRLISHPAVIQFLGSKPVLDPVGAAVVARLFLCPNPIPIVRVDMLEPEGRFGHPLLRRESEHGL